MDGFNQRKKSCILLFILILQYNELWEYENWQIVKKITKISRNLSFKIQD